MFCTYFFMGSYHTDIFGNINTSGYSHIPVWLFMVLAAISLIISWVFFYIGRDKNDKEEEAVEVVYKGRKVVADLLLDSGNFLKEPISGKSVIMMNREKSRQLLGEELFFHVVNKNTETLLKKRFRMVYAEGITDESKTFFAFFPDNIYATENKKKIELDAYIAVCDKKFAFGGCDGIAHPSVII